jgi:hypothetical protein
MDNLHMNIIRKMGEAKRREKAEKKRAKREMKRKLKSRRCLSSTQPCGSASFGTIHSASPSAGPDSDR